MQTITGKLYRDFSTDSFWTKVEFISDQSNRKTEVLLCASYEYLSQGLNRIEVNERAVNEWVARTVADLQKKGDVLFKKPTHFEMKAITEDGYKNGISFLKEKAESKEEPYKT